MNRYFNSNRGFTLLELIMSVAIIGILASISLYNYQGYRARSQVAEAFVLASTIKSQVIDAYNETGDFDLIDSGQHGVALAAQTGSTYIEEMEVKNGTIEITMKLTGISKAIQGKVFYLIPNALTDGEEGGSFEWNCKSFTLDLRFLPNYCTSFP